VTEAAKGDMDMASGRIAIGVDVGGSGIKVAVVDVEAGQLRSERLRVPTPNPATPGQVNATIIRLVKRLVKETSISDVAPVGVGLPGVAMDGVLLTAANIDPSWVDFPAAKELSSALGRPVTIVNDADAAGIAEMRFGVGAARTGVVVFLTLGTGVGSGVFIDGTLVPNTEFGQMEINGKPAERRSAYAARARRSLSWKAWSMDLDEHLQHIEELVWPTLFILGGGVSKNGDRFIPRLNRRTPVVAAELRNDAGIIGAAIVAAEAAQTAPASFAERLLAPPTPAGEAVEATDSAVDATPDATPDDPAAELETAFAAAEIEAALESAIEPEPEQDAQLDDAAGGVADGGSAVLVVPDGGRSDVLVVPAEEPPDVTVEPDTDLPG
jgi:polyphosphate glucokinase